MTDKTSNDEYVIEYLRPGSDEWHADIRLKGTRARPSVAKIMLSECRDAPARLATSGRLGTAPPAQFDGWHWRVRKETTTSEVQPW
jgi:hypothetical protein